MNETKPSDGEADQPKASDAQQKSFAQVGLLATIGSVLAAFFGVQSADNWKRDVEGGRPWLFFAVALFMTLALVLAILLVVRLVVSSGAGLSASDRSITSATVSVSDPAVYPATEGAANNPLTEEDLMARRVAPCTHCHLDVDIDTRSGYVPRIAGKPAGYLYSQLIHFRDGRRRHAVMNRIVQNLPEPYLLEMAEWFAARKVPYPQPVALANERQRARGLQLATIGDSEAGIPACGACHGETLVGMQPNVPGLLGLPETYLMAQFTAWRTGRRMAAAPDCMHRVANQLDIDDQQAVSAWLASRPVPDDTTPSAEQSLPIICGDIALPNVGTAAGAGK